MRSIYSFQNISAERTRSVYNSSQGALSNFCADTTVRVSKQTKGGRCSPGFANRRDRARLVRLKTAFGAPWCCFESV